MRTVPGLTPPFARRQRVCEKEPGAVAKPELDSTSTTPRHVDWRISMEWTGGCLCGAIRYHASDPPMWASYCHCGMCRKVSGAPYMGFVQFSEETFKWLRGRSAVYQSSEGVTRRFCGSCGSSLTFEADGMLFLSLGSLDFPEQVVVERHCYAARRLPGVGFADGLPRYPGPFGGKGGRPID